MCFLLQKDHDEFLCDVTGAREAPGDDDTLTSKQEKGRTPLIAQT